MNSFLDHIPTFRRIGKSVWRSLGAIARFIFSRRGLTRLAFSTACLLTLATAFYTVERHRWRSAWNDYEAKAKARGVRMESKDFPHPPVPDSQNFAQIPYFQGYYEKPESPDGLDGPVFYGLVNVISPSDIRSDIRSNEVTIAERVRNIANNPLVPRRSPNSLGDNPADIARATLLSLDEECGPVFRQLHEAIDRPFSWFLSELDGADPTAPKKVPFIRMRKAVQLASIRLTLHAAARDGTAAFEDLRLCLRVGEANKNHPFMQAAMIRVAITALAMDGIWVGLSEHVWDEPTLARIDSLLAEIDLFSASQFGRETERAFSNSMLLSFVEDRARLVKAFENPRKPHRWSYWSLFPTGWIYRNQIKTNQLSDLESAALDLQRRTMSLDRTPMARLIKSSSKVQDAIFLVIAPNYEWGLSRTAASEMLLRQARTACALERYRLKHNVYPEKLDTLIAATLLPEIPRDPTNNEPVEYRRTDDGRYTLRFPEAARLTREVAPWPEAWIPAGTPAQQP